MQYRQLPPAGERTDIETVWRAVPASPDGTDDCCARLCRRTHVESREHASEWLVFLTALGCVADDGDGYYRRDPPPAERGLGDVFESGLFGARAVLETLETATRPLTREEVFERLDEATGRRLSRMGDAGTYLDRLLEWGVALDLFETAGDGYTVPP